MSAVQQMYPQFWTDTVIYLLHEMQKPTYDWVALISGLYYYQVLLTEHLLMVFMEPCCN